MTQSKTEFLTPYDYQTLLAEDAAFILRETMMVYLAMEERTGKTLTSILVAEQLSIDSVLVITKKKALDGWHETLEKFETKHNYIVVNYHQAHKIKDKFDLVILDESHNYISSYPKPGTIYKQVKQLVYGKPIIYISATPYAQGPQQLFHQFSLSAWSPWKKFINFYKWFNTYGKPYTKEISGINIPQYDRCHVDKILDDVKHLFITKTRLELGFEQEPEDVVHYIELSDKTKEVYNELMQHDLVKLDCGMLVADTVSKLRTSLHQLEGGTIKIEDQYNVLDNREKADFILDKFGDSSSLVIMYNYKAEKTKLEAIFKRAKLLQATSFAEGVDLHEYDDLVIYSQDFSTARHTQRRARQANKLRKLPIRVHYLLVRKAISDQCYKTVSINKRNFVDSVFSKESI